mgnify:FL=1
MPFVFLVPIVRLLGTKYVPSIESTFDQLTLTLEAMSTKMT